MDMTDGERREQDRERKAQQPVKVLTADDILAIEDISIVPVDIPEWGGMVYVKAMTSLQRERYFEMLKRTVGKGRKAREKVVLEKASALLVQMTACNAQGELMFTREQVSALSLKASKPMERICDAASKLNGLDDEDEGDDDRKND
jgi:hypothetical protein